MFLVEKLKPQYLLAIFLVLLGGFFPAPLTCLAATVSVEVVQSRDRYPAGGSYPVLFRIRISNSWYIHGTKSGRDGLLIPTILSFSDSSGLEIKETNFPAPQEKRFEYARAPIEVFSGEILVPAKLIIRKETPPGKHGIKGRLSYQACSSNSCLPPETVPVSLSLAIVPEGTRTESINQAIFDIQGVVSASSGPVAGWKFGASLWLTLFGLFLGGLALNLTPCVYPLIPITVSFFGGRGEGAGGKPLIHGILYMSGLAFTNSVLGLIASLSGNMLGTVLQNPVVLIMVVAILLGLALSFFGLWEIRVPSGMTRLAAKNFGGYFGSFFIGLTLGIVAAPCLGPFILGLLTYVGQKGDPFLGFIYFFVLSIGIGLPLAILAIFSRGIHKLPMSGTWMVWIRKAFGWVLVGMGGYLLQPLIPGDLAKSVLFASIMVAAGLHLGWLDREGSNLRIFSYLKRGFGLVLFAGALTILLVIPREGEGVRWTPFNKTLIEEAVREGRPVVLDFYADWCGPCRALDKKVFRDPEVVKLSRNFLNIRVDLTTRHPEQEMLQRRYKIRGVPTIVFKNREGKEERPLRIESYVDKEDVLKRMRQLVGRPSEKDGHT